MPQHSATLKSSVTEGLIEKLQLSPEAILSFSSFRKALEPHLNLKGTVT